MTWTLHQRYHVDVQPVAGGVYVLITSRANGAPLWDAPLAWPLTPRGALTLSDVARHVPGMTRGHVENHILQAIPLQPKERVTA